MSNDKFAALFTPDVLQQIFPPQRTHDFFEALFGDAADGAYTIELTYKGYNANGAKLQFNLDLRERPGCCLACNMTYGLPQVFSRHPVINIKGLVAEIEAKLGTSKCTEWRLGHTLPLTKGHHAIPLFITLGGE